MAGEKMTVFRAPNVDREMKALSYSAARPAGIAFLNAEGEVEPTIPLPERTTAVRFQARLCGDVYCEIEGQRYVAGIGPSAREAFDQALGKSA